MAINHKTLYRQAFGCGQLLDSYEKSNNSLKSPTTQEYNDLPEAIKNQFANYNAYKIKVDGDNHQTKLAMKAKIQEMKSQYSDYTKGKPEDKVKFDEEADALISEIGV